MFCQCVKTRCKNNIIVAKVSKNVIKLTLVVPMCQNTSYNLHFFANVSKHVVKFASNWASETTFANIHGEVFKMLQMQLLRPILPMSTAEAPTASNYITSWDHLWPRCRSKDFAFRVHRWDHSNFCRQLSNTFFCYRNPFIKSLIKSFIKEFSETIFF